MRSIIIAIIFLLATIWSIVDRIRFERSSEASDDSKYASLYREHSLLRILLYALVTVISSLQYFGIE